MRRAAAFFLLTVGSCRQQITVDTSSAKFIPAPVAVENLLQLAKSALVVGCTPSAPKAIFQQEEIKEWKIDQQAIEFRVEERSPFRVGYSEITETRADRLLMGFQVRLFLPPMAESKKEHYLYFNFRDEAQARRTIELVDSLRAKK